MSMMKEFNARCSAAFAQPDLRKKIIFTLIMFLVARVGAYIPAPGVALDQFQNSANGGIFDFINMFSGGAFKRFSIFALGVMPYINASIIIQLLTAIYPPLEEKQKEGEKGRQEIVQMTRYLTIFIGGIQAAGMSFFMISSGVVRMSQGMFVINTIVILTAGTVFLMWVGEQISVYGIGNGISLIICLNIIARLPSATIGLIKRYIENGNAKIGFVVIAAIAAFVVILVAAIVIFQLAQRRIPILYAGRNMQGKNSIASKTYLPLKLNTAGVMPIIFASVLMMIPSAMLKLTEKVSQDLFLFLDKYVFGAGSIGYIVILAALVMFFTFFYTAMVFDPQKVADNLKKSGGTIPGVRPGEETVDYLEAVVTNMTWGGALFLTLLAVLPSVLSVIVGLPLYIGGTGLLIVVGVALDSVQQVNAHLVMRDYEGFIS
jgi:preprotein translocase subunit SecY